MSEVGTFLSLGNALWLDFVNTEIAVDGEPADLVESEADLRAWLAQFGVLGEGKLPEVTLLPRALGLRAFLRALASQFARGTSISEEAAETLNSLLSRRHGSMQLLRRGDGWELVFQSEDVQGADALVPLVHSAADLISAGDWRLVRKCEGPKCVLFFYDTSKNHKRRWCSMEGCGNRHKAAVHYRRQRHSKKEEGSNGAASCDEL